jgi:archaellum component FlaC
MRNIDSYLPKKIRFGVNASAAWCGRNFQNKESMSEETKELFDKVIDMLMQMKTRIENDLTVKYFMGGKLQYIEILKRRFKNNWTEKIETENENHDHVDGSMTLEIKFEDA